MEAGKQNNLVTLIVILIAGSGAGLAASTTLSQQDVLQLIDRHETNEALKFQEIKDWVTSLLNSSLRERDQLHQDVDDLRRQLSDAREQIAGLQSAISACSP